MTEGPVEQKMFLVGAEMSERRKKVHGIPLSTYRHYLSK